MKPRLIASLALGAAILVGTTGCNLVAPQATTIQYSASDGVNVYASGPVQVRNALIVANEDGSEGNFVAALINESAEPAVLEMNVGEGDDQTIRIPANSVLSLGDGETEPVLLENLDALPGSTVAVYFRSGDGEGTSIDVPVLDGSLDYLSDLVP